MTSPDEEWAVWVAEAWGGDEGAMGAPDLLRRAFREGWERSARSRALTNEAARTPPGERLGELLVGGRLSYGSAGDPQVSLEVELPRPPGSPVPVAPEWACVTAALRGGGVHLAVRARLTGGQLRDLGELLLELVGRVPR